MQLYDHIYHHYEELGGYEDMKPLLPGALELPSDKYRIRIEELEERLEAEKQKAKAEKQKAEAKVERLKQRIKELENQ